MSSVGRSLSRLLLLQRRRSLLQAVVVASPGFTPLSRTPPIVPRLSSCRGVTSSSRVSGYGVPAQRADIYERHRAPAVSSRLQAVSLLEEDRMLEAHWEDGEATRYPWVWLRDNCQCEKCFHEFTKARLILMKNLDVNVKPQKVEVRS